MYFIDVPGCDIITSLYIGDLRCIQNVSSFYIPSQGMIILADSREIKFLKIRNIESNLPCLAELTDGFL